MTLVDVVAALFCASAAAVVVLVGWWTAPCRCAVGGVLQAVCLSALLCLPRSGLAPRSLSGQPPAAGLCAGFEAKRKTRGVGVWGYLL